MVTLHKFYCPICDKSVGVPGSSVPRCRCGRIMDKDEKVVEVVKDEPSVEDDECTDEPLKVVEVDVNDLFK